MASYLDSAEKDLFFTALPGYPGSSGSKAFYLQCGRPGFDPWRGVVFLLTLTPQNKGLNGTFGFPGGSEGKASALPCNAGDLGSIPGSGRSPGERKQHPTPVLWPGKLYGQRSLVGYSPWGHKESDMTEQLHFTSPGYPFTQRSNTS